MLTRTAVALAAMIGASLLGIASAEARPDMISFRSDYAPGTIVVKTKERRLYLIIDQDRAVRYPVGVGKAGKQWAGTAEIEGKYRDPAWAPPADVKHDNPRIADVIAGGSPSNPMGVAAMTLSGGGQYAIHGTNRPQIGRPFRVIRLHPHVQRRHQRPLSARFHRNAGGGDAALIAACHSGRIAARSDPESRPKNFSKVRFRVRTFHAPGMTALYIIAMRCCTSFRDARRGSCGRDRSQASPPKHPAFAPWRHRRQPARYICRGRYW